MSYKYITSHSEIIRARNDWIKVDPQFEHLLYENVWSCSGGYAKRYKESFDGIKRHRWVEYLHRVIADAKAEDIVDHINEDKSDNRLSNLRLVGKSENLLNTSKSRGYTKRVLKNGQERYDVRLVYRKKIILCKTFRSIDEAIDTYQITKREILNGV